MDLSLIVPMTSGAALRARFFKSHGVTLESQFRSRSGVREEDGMVVFAMPVERVSVNAWGFSCLLWAGCDRLPNDALSLGTLRHCRLAAQRGIAEGFLLDRRHAPVERQELVELRVVKVGTEYWARWGKAARAELLRTGAFRRGARSP